MMEGPASRQQLLAENAALRARLHDAEETLLAIQGGEADAFVLSGADGEQIHTMTGALEPYRVMVEAMGEGAVTLAGEGTLLYCNSHFAEWVKLPREQIAGRAMQGMIAKQDRQRFAAMLPRGAQEVVRETLMLQAADGTQTPALFSLSPLPQSEGKVISVVIADLSEVVAATEARSRLALIVDSSDDAIASITLEGVVESWNRAAEQLFGYSADEAIGRPLQTLTILPEYTDEVSSRFDAIGHGEQTGRVECMWRRKDGSLVEVSVIYSPILDPAGSIVGASINTRDITVRKRVETELYKSELAYRTLAQNLPGMVYRVLIREGGRMQFFNAMPAQMTGYAAEELVIGKVCSIEPLILEEDRLGVETEVMRAISEKRAFAVEYRLMHKDGGIRWMLEHGMPVYGTDDAPIYIDGLIFDITERKQTQELLRQSEEKFRALVESTSDWIWEVDPNGVYTYVSPRVEALLGYPPEEVLGKTPFDFMHAEETQRVGEVFKDLIDKRAPLLALENANLHQDGHVVILETSGLPFYDDKGEFAGYRGIDRDITERKQSEVQLKKSTDLLQSVVENAPVRIFWKGCDLRLLGCNTLFAHDAGYANRNDMIGKSDYDMAWKEQAELYRADDMVVMESGNPKLGFEEPQTTPDGDTIWLRTSKVPLRDENGQIIGLLGLYDDITEQKRSEESIKYLNRVLSVLSGINTLIVRVNDREELLREACNIAVENGGFRMTMLVVVDPVTMLPVSVISAGKDEGLLENIKNVMSTSDGMETTLVARAIKERKAVISNDSQNDPRLLFGKQYAEAGVKSMTVMPLIISGEAFGALALYASEIEFFHQDEMKLLTELTDDIAFAIDHIDKQERLNYLAYYDVLTGLANRNLFLDRLTQYMHSAISSGQKIAIGMIDLARFKNINDSLGRPAGDALLKQVAKWLTQFVQDANLLARIDADHFAFVAPEIKTDRNLARLVESMIASFQEHSFNLNENTLRISIKIGIAVFPDDGDNVDSLYTNAEAALKKAKRSGEQYLFYTQKMTESVAYKLSLENQLRRAIDNEEFVLYYQPKVNIVSGKVTSAEALIRWNDPITGLVPPGKFIPILEETGMILEVGHWALHKAIEDNKRWRAAGLSTVRIAVNVSPLQLRNINYIDEVRQVIALDSYAASELELEITESLIMDNVEHNIAKLQAIRAMGITIAIDDFGTGFSSLSYLAKLPVDKLKIDRSFVIEMDKPEGLALVTTIIVMAHALNLKVIAEGVETDHQMRQLLSLNCDEMQGFLYSKAVPAEIFETRFLAPIVPDGKQ